MTLNLPKQQIHKCDGTADLSKPSREKRERIKAAKRADLETLKRDVNKEERGKVSAKFRRMVFDRDGWKCVKCGADPNVDDRVKLVLAHVRPIASGGKTTEENCQCWCKVCNDGQGAAKVWREEKDKQTAAFVQGTRERVKPGRSPSKGASHAKRRATDSLVDDGGDRDPGGAVPQHWLRDGARRGQRPDGVRGGRGEGA